MFHLDLSSLCSTSTKPLTITSPSCPEFLKLFTLPFLTPLSAPRLNGSCLSVWFLVLLHAALSLGIQWSPHSGHYRLEDQPPQFYQVLHWPLTIQTSWVLLDFMPLSLMFFQPMVEQSSPHSLTNPIVWVLISLHSAKVEHTPGKAAAKIFGGSQNTVHSFPIMYQFGKLESAGCSFHSGTTEHRM